MRKAVLMSILVVMVAAPILAAKGANSRAAFRKAIISTVVGILLYVLAVVIIYPRLAE